MAAARAILALVTAPNQKVARQIARASLKAKLAACANLIGRIESHYWWQGRLERGAEVLILLKTTRAHRAALEQCVLAHHPYDTPEFIWLDIAGGNRRYLAWLTQSVK